MDQLEDADRVAAAALLRRLLDDDGLEATDLERAFLAGAATALDQLPT